MTPVEASKKKNENTVYYNLYGDMKQLSSKPKFKIGDKVRISKYKRKVFDKGYTPNWTDEIFLGRVVQCWVKITRGTARFEFRFESLKSISVFILLVCKLKNGRSKSNRENYPRKCF